MAAFTCFIPLIFEGQAQLIQSRTKLQLVHVIVLSDILFFLMENSNSRFSFYTPENKVGVISLQKLLVREHAGSDNSNIFLISSNPTNPEMFDLRIVKPKGKPAWINSIRLAVQNCPEDNQMFEGNIWDDQRRQLITSQAYMHQIISDLQQKDVEQALIYEEKMVLLLKLLSAVGLEVDIEPPSYRQLIVQYLDSDTVRKEVLNTMQEMHEITSAFYNCDTNLYRSASSVGERQSDVYISPILPRRAETFGGFDKALSCTGSKSLQQVHQKHGHNVCEKTELQQKNITKKVSPKSEFETMQSPRQYLMNSFKKCPSQIERPPIMQLEAAEQSAVVLLTSHIYKLASIIAQQMSSIDSLKAQILLCRQELNQPSSERERKPIYKLNQQLEELRNLQDKLTQEKQQWQRERDAEENDLEEKRQQLQKLQIQVRMEQEDVTEQREQLYRKLEAVSSQGLVNAANPPLLLSPQSGPFQSSNTSTLSPTLSMDLSGGKYTFTSTSIPSSSSSSPFNTWKHQRESLCWSKLPVSTSNQLPLNLISATNQQKVATNVQIKQKLPLKLAVKPERSAPHCSSGNVSRGDNSGTTSPMARIPTTSALSAVSHLCSSSTLPSNSHQKSQSSKASSFLRKSTPRLLNIKLSSQKDDL